MRKEYTFQEVIANIKEGEIYESTEKMYTIEEITIKNNVIQFIGENISGINLRQRFRLKETPIDFMEAVKAYSNGKTIYCMIEGECYTYIPDYETEDVDHMNQMMDARYGEVSSYEILNGKWFIKQ